MAKKIGLLFLLLAMFCLCACSSNKNEQTKEDPATVEVNKHNAEVLSTELGVDAESEELDSALEVLQTIKTGKIQYAEAIGAEDARVVQIIAEDGTEYHMYLTSDLHVDSVKDIKSDEWVVGPRSN